MSKGCGPTIAPRTHTKPWVNALELRRSPLVADSALEGDGFEPVWGFSCQAVVFGLLSVLCSEGKAVLRSVAAIRFAERAERGQGTETVAKLGGLPPSELVFGSALTPEHAER
jgi:hypothetical protein